MFKKKDISEPLYPKDFNEVQAPSYEEYKKYIQETSQDLGRQHEERLKAWNTIEEQTWSSAEELGLGIWVYRDVLIPELNIISTIEKIINDSDGRYTWQEAFVGYMQVMPEYRDCNDFKYKNPDVMHDYSENGKLLWEFYEKVKYRQLQAVKDYSFNHRVGELRYWEATNFVRYNVGHHFEEHTDHGYSYNCVVSIVGYPNDDYEGGELEFRLQGIKVKPKAGDLYIFPSNFVYPHKSLPVISGTKYSLVTMLDYSKKYHDPSFYQETGE